MRLRESQRGLKDWQGSRFMRFARVSEGSQRLAGLALRALAWV